MFISQQGWLVSCWHNVAKRLGAWYNLLQAKRLGGAMSQGQMTVGEAGKKGGQSTSRDKQDAARKNGKKHRRIETLLKKDK